MKDNKEKESAKWQENLADEYNAAVKEDGETQSRVSYSKSYFSVNIICRIWGHQCFQDELQLEEG